MLAGHSKPGETEYTNEAQRSNTPGVMAVIAKCKRSNENYFMYHLVRTARLGAPTSTVVLDFRKTVISGFGMLDFKCLLLLVCPSRNLTGLSVES